MAIIKAVRPHIVHVIYRLDTGGMENGLVNLINWMEDGCFDHSIVCLTGYTEFRNRISKKDVPVYALNKKPGHDLMLYFRVWSLFRKLKPTIVHTRNLAALEMNVIAKLAGVKCRIHGEHGRDIYDLEGKNRKYRILRRLCNGFVHRYITVSMDLYNWYIDDLKFNSRKVTQIYNGVDKYRFNPVDKSVIRARYPAGFNLAENFIMGTVGRLQQVKNQKYLIQAFSRLQARDSLLTKNLRLVVIGDGDCRQELESLAKNITLHDTVWFAGERPDVASLLCGFNLFILPSMAEGISNTILEAMSSGLPVVATDVGGNVELIENGKTGYLVPTGEPDTLADAMFRYLADHTLSKQHGLDARRRIEMSFSKENMVNSYKRVYEDVINESQRLS